MADNEWDILMGQARELARAVGTLYEDLTGEKLDIESAIRHYPLAAFGAVAGAGALAGWWFGRRSAPAALPPPIETSEKAPAHPLNFLEEVLPGTMERVRSSLPEIAVPDEIKLQARSWLERELPARMDSLAEQMDQRLSGWVKGRLNRFDRGDDIHLEDPPTS